MNPARIIVISAVALTLAACGSNFEWFPTVTDTAAPTVTATANGNKLFSNRTTHFTPPLVVRFSASEPATIYFTTSGSEPSTASPSVEYSTSGVDGPSITATDTILKFFGIDKSTKKNQSATQTHFFKTP
jgi:hypothetical protein